MLVVQCAGYVFDALWHGLLQRGVEPQTFPDMLRHLATVHLPLYVGAFGVLVTTGLALARHRMRPAQSGRSLAIAFGGAVLSATGEGWHAVAHLQMDTGAAPLAGTLSFVGFLIVVAAMGYETRQRRRRAQVASHRRAA